MVNGREFAVKPRCVVILVRVDLIPEMLLELHSTCGQMMQENGEDEDQPQRRRFECALEGSRCFFSQHI